jgi:hypothetical protein
MTQKIIFSLTAHENLECLIDLLINIKKCFVHYEILILLSLTEYLYNEKLQTFDYVKCVTIRKQELPIWGNIELFNQHILNIKYIYDNSINYDFFWMVASNEMFIKIIPPDFLDNNSIKIIHKKEPIDEINYDIYFKDIMNNQQWYWTDLAKKDTYFMDYIYKSKFILHFCQHEGLVLSCNIILEIFNEYTTNKLNENSTFKGYIMEELFIPTFLINRYHLNSYPTFCFRYNYNYTLGPNPSYTRIVKKLERHHVSIKPVNRDYNDKMRQFIRNKIT